MRYGFVHGISVCECHYIVLVITNIGIYDAFKMKLITQYTLSSKYFSDIVMYQNEIGRECSKYTKTKSISKSSV
jgi:hypothetical protein